MKEHVYREKLINLIIREELEFERNHNDNGESDYANLLRKGFVGYEKMPTEDLESQFFLRYGDHPDFEQILDGVDDVYIKNEDFIEALKANWPAHG